MIGIDPLYFIIMIPVFLFSLFASIRVKTTVKKYSQVRAMCGKTGAEIAEELLRTNNINDVNVTRVDGFLSDHYDPHKKVVRLSPDVYAGNSIVSIGVAAHETGHAIQHAQGYKPLKLRSLLVPTASVGSNLSWVIIFVGFLLAGLGSQYGVPFVKLGIVLFAAVVFFQLVTLPVEFNASRRAEQILASQGLVSSQDLTGVKKVLSSAAMTYVAAAASAIATLLYYIIRLGLLTSNDE